MHHKAQLQQVFIYIMAIIVIGFLALLGYRMVGNILNNQCQVDQQQFITALDRHLDSSTRYGTMTKAVLNVPCHYDRVCFLDARAIGVPLTPSSDSHYPIIAVNAEDGLPWNVYLVTRDVLNNETYPFAYDERIRIGREAITGDELLCVDATANRFVFWLEGLGKDGISLSVED